MRCAVFMTWDGRVVGKARYVEIGNHLPDSLVRDGVSLDGWMDEWMEGIEG